MTENILQTQADKLKSSLIKKSEEALQFTGLFFGLKKADSAERQFHHDRISRLTEAKVKEPYPMETSDTPQYSYRKVGNNDQLPQ